MKLKVLRPGHLLRRFEVPPQPARRGGLPSADGKVTAYDYGFADRDGGPPNVVQGK